MVWKSGPGNGYTKPKSQYWKANIIIPNPLCFGLRWNIIYTGLFWKCWNIKEFGQKFLLVTLGKKSLWSIIPRKIISFYIRIGLFPITIITAFFDVGVCIPIIFGAFKLRFQAKVLRKVLVEVLKPKTACLCFMVINNLTVLTVLTAVKSRCNFSCQKMLINNPVVHL